MIRSLPGGLFDRRSALMRDHAILDLVVHAGRDDLFRFQVILARVGAALDDGLRTRLADAGQLCQFGFGSTVQVQLAGLPC